MAPSLVLNAMKASCTHHLGRKMIWWLFHAKLLILAPQDSLMPLTHATRARTHAQNAKWKIYMISALTPVLNAAQDSSQTVNRAVLWQSIQYLAVPSVPIYYLLIQSPKHLVNVKNVPITVLIALPSIVYMSFVINVQSHIPFVMGYFALNHAIQEVIWTPLWTFVYSATPLAVPATAYTRQTA